MNLSPEQTPLMTEADHSEARELSRRLSQPPTVVPGYESFQFIGRGAFGEVWSAVSRNTGVRVAIKFYTRGRQDWNNLQREVEKLRQLATDRYFVQLLEVGWDADPPYYIMEYMENGSLEDLVRAGPLPAEDTARYLEQVARALVQAHNKGILHCDLKPANVLLDAQRQARLTDFGQARMAGDLSPALGTLFYMAPEQADLTATPDARWDVYALGAMAYRMLTGRPPHYRDEPFPGRTLEEQLHAYRRFILDAPRPDAHRRVPGVDRDLAAVIDRCLEPRPARRFPNAQAVVEALEACERHRKQRPLLGTIVVGFLALLVAIAAVGLVLFNRTMDTAREQVLRRTREAGRFAAQGEAQLLAQEILHRWRILESEARDPQLAAWLKQRPEEAARQDHPLDRWLAERLYRYRPDFRAGAREDLWYALDRHGLMRGMYDKTDPHLADRERHRYYGWRDYFHGLGRNLPRVRPPTPDRPPVITRPHCSIAYRRLSAKVWAISFSVPVWDTTAPGGREQEPVGVLGMAVNFEPADNPVGAERFSVLIDTRPDETGRPGLIVRHPYLHFIRNQTFDEDHPFPVYHADQLLGALTRDDRDPAVTFPDPTAGDYPTFQGQWLVEAVPVEVPTDGGQPRPTGLLVLIQTRQEAVLAPLDELWQSLMIGGGVAGTCLLAVMTVVWLATVLILDEDPKSPLARRLRRWIVSGGSSRASDSFSPTGGRGSTRPTGGAAGPTVPQSPEAPTRTYPPPPASA